MVLEEHPTCRKFHATKLDDYLTCPRYSMYKQVFGWQREARHNHRSFGSAWHEVMETFLLEGYTTEALANGMEKFITRYRRDWGPETDELFAPKTPSTALTAAALYIQEYSAVDAKQEVLHTEACGGVPISATRLIRFKQDSILRDDRGVFSREHKTASNLGRQNIDKWPLSMQVGTYQHVLYCLYPESEVWGVQVNITAFQKTQIKFGRVPCRASMPMLNAWLVDVNAWIDDLERDLDRFFKPGSIDEPALLSFPRNPLSCTNFYGCEYHPLCLSWPNPLQHYEDGPPIGFYQEYWDPEVTSEDGDELEKKENLGVIA